MKASETLTKALEILDNGKKWCKGYFAQNANGVFVEPEDESACAYCAMGAICKVKDGFLQGALEYMRHVLQLEKFTENITRFNDSADTTFDDVKAVFERAIQLAQAEGN